MIKLTLRQANQPETTVQVDGDVATIGRAPGAEVLIQQPYVSKRHARLLRGWVLVDLGSSNGTFVGGKRISEATLLSGDEFQLGEGDVVVRVWRDEAAKASDGASGGGDELERLRASLAEKSEELAAAHGIVDRLHQKSEQLRAEVQRLRGATPPPRDSTPQPSLAAAPAPTEETLALGVANEQIQRLTAERNQLLRDMDEERTLVEQLTAQMQRIETDRAAQRAELARVSAALAAAASLEELELARTESSRLATELARCTRELDEARQQLAASAQAPALAAAPAGPMGDLLIRLQAENSALKRQLSESGGGAAGGGAPGAARPSDPGAPRMLAELLELRAQNQALKSQLDQRSRSVPAQMVSPMHTVGALWNQLADRDIEQVQPLLDGSPEEFVAVELFRVARQFERVVTRVAGAQIQLYQSNTMLPNVEGNLRGLVGTILGDPSERDARAELVRYFEQLGKWLVAGLAANRKASKLFAEKLKHDLSEAGLLAQGPIPAFRKLAGGAETELWRRACTYLKELSPDMLEDQLEKLAREAVRDMLGTNAG